MKIEDLLEALPDLSEDELKSVQARVRLLLGANQEPTDRNYSSFLSGFTEVLRRTCDARGIKLPPAGSRVYGVEYARNVDAIRELIEENLKNRTQARRFAVSKFLVDRLLDWMNEKSIVLVGNSILKNLDRVPGILDSDFPGYRQNGILPSLFERAAWGIKGK